MLCKSSRFDLEPKKASEEVAASSSPQSTSIASEDTVVLVTVEEIGEGVDLGRWISAVACCSGWLSLSTGEAWSICLEASKGALTQRTGGSTLPGGGDCVVELMKGSGLRSEGGIRSGLEDLDLLGVFGNSTGFMLSETVTELAAGV